MSNELCEPNPLYAAHYADRATQRRVRIIENVQLAQSTYRVRFACPEIASQILPGQFLMLRLAGLNDPLLARPLALYDVVANAAGEPHAIDVVYLVLGKMTTRLSLARSGDELELWGPLGNGFPLEPIEHLIMVAGGIGQTPFLALGQEYLGRRQFGSRRRAADDAASKVTLCYGVRSAPFAAGVDDFRGAGFDVRLASDDGTLGHHGFVTDLLQQTLDETAGVKRLVVCCGPEPMMAAAAERCRVAAARCLVSLETPMACGIGICFSCVAKVCQSDGEWDYKRTCVEGPIFDAEKIVW